MKPLLLASSSTTRQKLLHDAGIPFISVAHSYEEPRVSEVLVSDVEAMTLFIALQKANAIDLSAAWDTFFSLEEIFAEKRLFVLAADTLVVSCDDVAMGKPRNYEEAVVMLRQLGEQVSVVTSYVCRAYQYDVNGWICEKEERKSVRSRVFLDLPESWIHWYLSVHKDFLFTAGALEVEKAGTLFIKSIEGCPTTVLGLPMHQLRSSLQAIGFFEECF